MKRQEIIKLINEQLEKYDKDTLEAIYMSLSNINDDVKKRLIKKISKEDDASIINYLWQLIIRL